MTNIFMQSYPFVVFAVRENTGETVKGEMAASILPTFAIQKVTDDNLRKHFSFSGVRAASLCGGSTITREAFYALKKSNI